MSPGTKGGVTANLRRITARHIRGVLTPGSLCEAISFENDVDFDTNTPSGAGSGYGINISDVEVQQNAAYPVFQIDQTVQSLTLSDVKVAGTNTAAPVFNLVGGLGAVISQLSCRDWVVDSPRSNIFSDSGNISDWSITGCQMLGENNAGSPDPNTPDQCFVSVINGGHFDRLVISSLSMNFGGSVVYADPGSNSTPKYVTVSGSSITRVKRIFYCGVSVDCALTGCRIDGLQNDIATANGGGFTFHAASNSYGTMGGSFQTFSNPNGGERATSPDLPMDLSKLTKNNATGDLANNSNGGLSCGAGLCVWTGSNWKNLATGATY